MVLLDCQHDIGWWQLTSNNKVANTIDNNDKKSSLCKKDNYLKNKGETAYEVSISSYNRIRTTHSETGKTTREFCTHSLTPKQSHP